MTEPDKGRSSLIVSMQRTRDASWPRIRLQFTALYASTLLVVLVVAGGALRFALRGALEREFNESVINSAALIQQFFRTELHEPLTMEGTIIHVTQELVFEDRAVRVRRPDGTLVGDSVAQLGRSGRNVDGPFRSVRFPLDSLNAPGYEVEVRASLANVVELQRRIDRWFLMGAPVLMICAAAAGWWLTGRTLRPVGAMADAAARISPASGARLPVGNPDDEIGRLGVRFNALLDRLDGALKQQRQFLADAAHELRTPIARMRARIELALLDENAGGEDSPAQMVSTLRALEGEVKSVSQHVDELLQLARADAGGDLLSVRDFFLDDLVADELKRWRPQAIRAGVSLDFDRIEETPVRADPILVGRLVGVLVDNALRYSESGAVVTISVYPDDGEARLDVADRGFGILPDDRERIFDRFFRGEDARHKSADGSGLGLAIAEWIVTHHGGRIEAAARSGGGTVFTVRLPLRAA